MRKRERENPCGVCGHYHKYEEGEVCGICGHRMQAPSEKTSVHVSAFPSEMLPQFLYLGSYDNASRSELLKTQGISHILNTVPACQNLYKNSFTYHLLQDDKVLPFDDANQFLEQCEKEKARVLVHCMSGKNRSPAIVIAYLMKSKCWRLAQSYQWVKERRPTVDLSEGVYQQLQEYETKLFGPADGSHPSLSFPTLNMQPFSFGYQKMSDPIVPPVFNTVGSPSIFSRQNLEIPPQGFTFGASNPNQNVSEGGFGVNGSDIPMDGS